MKAAARIVAVALAAAIALPSPARTQPKELESRVMVLPVEGAAPKDLGDLNGDVDGALARGAGRLTPTVARATATLDDTAVIVGCDPAEASCLDAVAAALNVDQLLIARVSVSGADASVEVTAVTREAEPVTQTFVIHKATRAADLAKLEEAVPVMLEAGEGKKPLPGEDTGTGTGTGTGTDSGIGVGTGTGTGTSGGGGGGGSTGPLITIGAGVVALAAGGVFWGLASVKQGEIDDAPTSTPEDLDRLADLEAAGQLRANVGNVLVVAGALVAAGGVTWYLLGRKGRDESLHASPVIVPGGAGIAIGGAW
jgi:hypothetical protein